MELSLLTKFRIGAAFAVGILLIGLVSAPETETGGYSAVSVAGGEVGVGELMILVAAAFFCGMISYFICWPYGREIGILAVPGGLGLLGLRSAGLASLTQLNPGVEYRAMLFRNFSLEAFCWLGIVAAGFAGVYVAEYIYKAKVTYPDVELEGKRERKGYLQILLAISASVIIADICIELFARDVVLYGGELGSVIAQPANGQIAFAVFISFGIAGFVTKKWVGCHYIWTILAAGFVIPFAMVTSLKGDVLRRLVSYWPDNFFPNPVLAVLPIQLVSFGTLGAIAGYWVAVRYEYWRKHEMN